MAKYNVQTAQSSKKRNVWILMGVIFFVVLIAAFIIGESSPRNEYLKDLQLSKATIAEKATEDGKYYIRLRVNVVLSTDDSWFEVTKSYFDERNVGDEAGVLLGNYDIFKKNLFGKGQSFEKSVWSIQDVYKTYEAAQSANPIKKYTGSTLLKKKKTTGSGTNFFALEAEQRVFNLEVNKEIYDKYNENQKVECEFEALGDFVKILGVKQ